MTSFISTNSRSGVPFLKSRRIRPTISPRTAFVSHDSHAAARLFDVWVSRASQRRQVLRGDGGGNRLIHFVAMEAPILPCHNPRDVGEFACAL